MYYKFLTCFSKCSDNLPNWRSLCTESNISNFGRSPQKSEKRKRRRILVCPFWGCEYGVTNWQKRIVVQNTQTLWFGVISWSIWVSCTQCHFAPGVTTRPMKLIQGKNDIRVQLIKILWPKVILRLTLSKCTMLKGVNGSLGLDEYQFLVNCDMTWAACLAVSLSVKNRKLSSPNPKEQFCCNCMSCISQVDQLNYLVFSEMPILTRTTTSQTPWPSLVRDDQSYFNL